MIGVNGRVAPSFRDECAAHQSAARIRGRGNEILGYELGVSWQKRRNFCNFKWVLRSKTPPGSLEVQPFL